MEASASRLFHTIVIVGASMGCASNPSGSAPSDSGSPPDAGDASMGSPLHPIVVEPCLALDAGAGPCNVCDCARPGMFRCSTCSSGSTPVDGRCPNGDGLGCHCDPSIVIASPLDCPDPAQFVCDPAPPTNADLETAGWYAFARCSCDPMRPTMPSQCADERTRFGCSTLWCPADAAGGPLGHVGYACACLPPPVPIAVAP